MSAAISIAMRTIDLASLATVTGGAARTRTVVNNTPIQSGIWINGAQIDPANPPSGVSINQSGGSLEINIGGSSSGGNTTAISQ